MNDSGLVQLRPLTTLPSRVTTQTGQVWPGALVCAGIAVIATVIGHFVPVIGSAVPAIVIGVTIATFVTPHPRLRAGIGWTSKFLLQCAVVLLGSQLSLRSVASVGLAALPVMVVSLLACLAGAALLGRLLGIDRDIRTLIGVGTGICGASAIAAVSPVIAARSNDISYAISTVFLFNILAVLVFPPIGHALGMDDHAFGLFAGTAVNDTSSVVAAASVFAPSALAFAVVVKLVRTLMIIPISATLAVVRAREAQSTARLGARQLLGLVPWFLVGFLVVAVIASTGLVPETVSSGLTQVSVFLVTMALAGIGLSTDLDAIRLTGMRPLALGGILSVITAAVTLAMMALLGHLG